MKKLTICICTLFFLARCGKENILWWENNVPYEILRIELKDQNGIWYDALPSTFPFNHHITIIRHIMNDGEVKVTQTESYPVTYTTYGGWYYDNYYGCWIYDYTPITYTTNWESSTSKSYHFTWNRYGNDDYIRLDFSDEDPKLNGTDPTFWNLLSQKYIVKKDSRKSGTLVAGILILESENARIILKR